MLDRYEPSQFEQKWRDAWQAADLFRTREEEGREKFYGLEFFPYPSGAGLSVGHCRNYVPTDTLCRMKYMQGYNVLHPMGFDAFGLPAENEAIKRKRHPATMIDEYAANYRRQMDLIGISYDWSRSFKSSDPAYYKWTQWIFKLLYSKGLAERRMVAVNWDPIDKTVLADEEVIAGRAERSGALVEKKYIPQWVFKITDYAQRLLDDLDDLDWPEGIKQQQRNWIGRSEGVEFEMKIKLPEKAKKSYEEAISEVVSALPHLWEQYEAGMERLRSAREVVAAASEESDDYAAVLTSLDEIIRDAEALGEPLGHRAQADSDQIELNAETMQAKADAVEDALENLGDRVKEIETDDPASVDNRTRIFTLLREAEDTFDTIEDAFEEVVEARPAGEDDLEVVTKSSAPSFRVFTTRIDTIFGVTFCVLAPEHPMVEKIKAAVDKEHQESISRYQQKAKELSDIDRQAEGREKTGVFTGAYAINPATKSEVPIYIADYVLMGYGTGAIMAVPGHDERDFEFAQKHGLQVKRVIGPIRTGSPYSSRTSAKIQGAWLSRNKQYDLESHPNPVVVAVNIFNQITPLSRRPSRLVQEAKRCLELAGRRSESSNKHTLFRYIQLIEAHTSAWVINASYSDLELFTRLDSRKAIIRDLVSHYADEEQSSLYTISYTLWSNRLRQWLPWLSNSYDLNTDDGFLVNSGEYDKLSVRVARQRLGQWMEALGIGERKVNFRLRDWLISRQRYWGCPIPIVYDKEGNEETVPDELLPVELPEVNHYEPSGDGTSPLAGIPEFVNCTTRDGSLGQRETDTMGGFACSSWYFLRFCDPHNPDQPWDQKKADYWMPVDCYVGGAEHAVMHLLYARFWTKVLYDAGLVSVKEPFQRLMNQGQVLGHTPYRQPREGEKLGVGEEGILVSYEEAEKLPEDEITWRWVRMSKSKGNVVTPDEAVAEYGADALRLFELFVAPFEANVEWNSQGMQGTARFLSRVMRLVSDQLENYNGNWPNEIRSAEPTKLSTAIRRITHQTILKATEDINRFAFNTYVSSMMIMLNSLTDELKGAKELSESEKLAVSEAIESLVLILSPAAPHTADELWRGLGRNGFTYSADWPTADPELAKEDVVTIAVQVNGKLRDTIEVDANADVETVKQAAMDSENVQRHIEGATVRKVIVIPKKLVNIVAN